MKLFVESHVLNSFGNPLSTNTTISALWRRSKMDADSYEKQQTNTHNLPVRTWQRGWKAKYHAGLYYYGRNVCKRYGVQSLLYATL